MTETRSPPPEDAGAELHELRSRVEQLSVALEEVRAHAARLEALAHEDALTGVLNRRGFLRDLTRALAFAARYNAPAALLLADLDAFKPVNDRYGHPVGDKALRHVADLLRANIRASDSVGRVGGDEFAFIIWQVDAPAAEQKARFIEELIAAAPLTIGTAALRLGASVGATLLRAEDAPEEALARADRAMYARKEERGERARSAQVDPG
jgi:diguanylate cyclase (GGDEF)-like protein